MKYFILFFKFIFIDLNIVDIVTTTKANFELFHATIYKKNSSQFGTIFLRNLHYLQKIICKRIYTIKSTNDLVR